MILKKPYAFMIKHFKSIHVIMILISLYVINKIGYIFSFFNDYVNNNYSTRVTGDLTSKYITMDLFIVTGIFALITFSVIFLLRSKNQKIKIYSMSLLFYIALIVVYMVFSGVFNQLETGVITADSARFYRDLAAIIYIVPMLISIYYIYSALTFNSHKYSSDSEKTIVGISREDNEEVEINIEFETYKANRNFRRFFREFKYYIQENKAIIIILLIAILGYTIYAIVNYNTTFGDAVIREGNYFYHENLEISVEKTIVTNIDLGGKEIEDGKYYVVTQMNIINNNNYDVKIDTNEFILSINDKEYRPNISVSDNFLDYGSTIDNSIIKYSTNDIYILVYEIDEKEKDENLRLKVLNTFIFEEDYSKATYKVVNLDGIILENNIKIDSVLAGEVISFENSNIGKSSLVVSGVEFGDSYTYEYEKCYGDNCNTYQDIINVGVAGEGARKTLMIMEAELVLDESTEYYQNFRSSDKFFENFAEIEYIVDGKTYYDKMSGVAAPNVKDKLIVRVPEGLEDATTGKIVITIRNKVFEIVIKNFSISMD